MDSASSDATTKRFTCNLQKRIPPWERLNHKDGRENGKNGKVERCPLTHDERVSYRNASAACE